MHPFSILVALCLLFGLGGTEQAKIPIEEDPAYFEYQDIAEVRLIGMEA